MALLQIVYLPRRGTQERWRRLCQEVAELRQDQFAAVCQQAGITQVQVRLLQLRHNELLLITMQMQEPQQAREALSNSQSPFACWLREQLQGLLGWDVQEVLTDPPADLLFSVSNMQQALDRFLVLSDPPADVLFSWEGEDVSVS